VVRGDAIDHLCRLAQPLGDVRSDGGVRAVHLVVDRLADVVQQAAFPRQRTSAPSSDAMMLARMDVSMEWANTFCP